MSRILSGLSFKGVGSQALGRLIVSGGLVLSGENLGPGNFLASWFKVEEELSRWKAHVAPSNKYNLYIGMGYALKQEPCQVNINHVI